jgi:hypothetical protein
LLAGNISLSSLATYNYYKEVYALVATLALPRYSQKAIPV